MNFAKALLNQITGNGASLISEFHLYSLQTPVFKRDNFFFFACNHQHVTAFQCKRGIRVFNPAGAAADKQEFDAVSRHRKRADCFADGVCFCSQRKSVADGFAIFAESCLIITTDKQTLQRGITAVADICHRLIDVPVRRAVA